ncbi:MULTISPECIES: thioredoxin domain-containing protein [unclassified Streptomyces]|uniref:thioredoxin domain-containing protein n=1 Tax=unclassified Streptomyces TaxID=2593676 RepID=UPI0037FEECBE
MQAEREARAKKERLYRRLTVSGSVLGGAALLTGVIIAVTGSGGGKSDSHTAAALKGPLVVPQHTSGTDGTVITYGDPAAKRTLDVYEDPRCPFCDIMERGLGATMQQLADEDKLLVLTSKVPGLDQAALKKAVHDGTYLPWTAKVDKATGKDLSAAWKKAGLKGAGHCLRREPIRQGLHAGAGQLRLSVRPRHCGPALERDRTAGGQGRQETPAPPLEPAGGRQAIGARTLDPETPDAFGIVEPKGKEAQAIAEADQDITALSKLRKYMSAEEWKAYVERLAALLPDTGGANPPRCGSALPLPGLPRAGRPPAPADRARAPRG